METCPGKEETSTSVMPDCNCKAGREDGRDIHGDSDLVWEELNSKTAKE